ncbi:hypothetical protein DQ244_17235 [Blastococcus sp. TBT05-19]|nr:hypothetical protein DQ244_17235 [Blastococcus sp. TBT05-19]
MTDEGRHTSTEAGRAEAARRHGVTPAARTREAERLAQEEAALRPASLGEPLDAFDFRARYRARREHYLRRYVY